MPKGIKIGYVGVGRYLPEMRLTNAHLEKIVDTSDEWIVQRTGIRERRVLGEGEDLVTMATGAAREAINNAGINADQIECIHVGVNTHMQFPSLACMVQNELNIPNASSSDISAGCASFVFCVEEVFNRMVTDWTLYGKKSYALAIGADALSTVTDWTNRSTCILFGDAAGAVVIGPVESGEILSTFTRTQGKYRNLLYLDPFLDRLIKDPETGDVNLSKRTNYPFLRMEGTKVFPVAVRSMISDIKTVVNNYNKINGSAITVNDIEYAIPHQANLRIVSAVADGLKLSKENVYSDGVVKYGNTSSASIPIGYVDQLGKRPGALVVDVSFGAGFASGAILRRDPKAKV